MAKTELKSLTTELLRGSVVRKEALGGILYCPALNTQILINEDLYDLLVAFFTEDSDKKAINTEGWSSSDIEELIETELTLSYDDRISNSKSTPFNLPPQFRITAPIQVILEITEKCNQRCNFCYAADGKKQKSELSYEEITNIIDQAADMGVFRMHLMGGEPLVRNDFIKLLDYISEAGLWVSFTTNGVLLNDTLAKLTKIPTLLPIQISLHSSDGEVYPKYGIPKENFRKTIDNCKLLNENNIGFGLKSVISKHNYTDVYKIGKKACELGARSITFLNMLPIGRGKDKQDNSYLKSKYLQTVMEDLERTEELPIHVDMRTFLNIYFPNEPKSNLEKYVSCPSGNIDMRIRSDGMVIQCSTVREEMFNIRKTRLEKAWEEYDKRKIPCPYGRCSIFSPSPC